MNSIAARLLVVGSLVLAPFVVLISLALRHSAHQRAENALYSKMQGMIYGISGAAELVDDAHLQVSEAQLPEQWHVQIATTDAASGVAQLTPL